MDIYSVRCTVIQLASFTCIISHNILASVRTLTNSMNTISCLGLKCRWRPKQSSYIVLSAGKVLNSPYKAVLHREINLGRRYFLQQFRTPVCTLTGVVWNCKPAPDHYYVNISALTCYPGCCRACCRRACRVHVVKLAYTSVTCRLIVLQ